MCAAAGERRAGAQPAAQDPRPGGHSPGPDRSGLSPSHAMQVPPPGRDCALTYRLLFPRDLFSLSSLPLCTWWPLRTQGWQMEGWAGTCL